MQDLGWEEGENELAMRINFKAQNAKYNGSQLSALAKLGCIVVVAADWGTGNEEVARGSIIDWEPSISSRQDTFDVTAYDELFNLQHSQDNRYITEGTGTKSALTAIFNDWGIPVGEYKGPDISHAKILFKNDCLSDIIYELLEAAEKQGAKECVVRATKGKVDVIPKGSNETIYHFDADNNIEVARDKMSTQNLITRVKIVATQKKDKRQPVEAIVDGKTEYGIRQRIYNRKKEDSLATAKAAAQEIIDSAGEPERTIIIESPDVPPIRKGDKVHVTTQTLDGYFIVKSVRHNAKICAMSMEIEPAEPGKQEESTAGSEFEKGDKVVLNGAVYVDSYGNGKGDTYSNYACTITMKVDTGRQCPYHVDGIGWVYPNSITKA